jgi:hypothetical protein
VKDPKAMIDLMAGETGFAILHDGQGSRIVRVHDGTRFVEIHESDLGDDHGIIAIVYQANDALIELVYERAYEALAKQPLQEESQ